MANDWINEALVAKTVLTGLLGAASFVAILLEHVPRFSRFNHNRTTHIPIYAQCTLGAVFLTAVYTIYNDWNQAEKDFKDDVTAQERFDTSVHRLDSITGRLSLMDEAQKIKALADSQRFGENLGMLGTISQDLDSTSAVLSQNVQYAQQAVAETYNVLQMTRSAVTELSYPIDNATLRIRLKYANNVCPYRIDEIIQRMKPWTCLPLESRPNHTSYYFPSSYMKRFRKEHADIYDSLMMHHISLNIFNAYDSLPLFSYSFANAPHSLTIDVEGDTTYYFYTYRASLSVDSKNETSKPTIHWFRWTRLYMSIDYFSDLRYACPVLFGGNFDLCFDNGYCLEFSGGHHDKQGSMMGYWMWPLGEAIEPFIHYRGQRGSDIE